MSGTIRLPDDKELPVDGRGYLLDWTVWSHTVAETMAADDGVELGPDHWRVLELMRDWYGEHGIEPPMRALILRLRRVTGNDALGSRDLYRLFPDGPVRQACRYAGLPRPVSCV